MGPALGELIDEVESYLPNAPPTGPATQPVVSLDLRTPLGAVSLFTVIATLLGPPHHADRGNRVQVLDQHPVDGESPLA
jgi:hypothetical protein